MEALLTSILNWTTDNWQVILGLFGGGAAVSLTLEALLHKLHIDSKKLAFTLLQVLGVLGAVVTYLVANQPTSDVPAVYAGLVIAAQAIHRFLLSPVYIKHIKPYLEYKAATNFTTPLVPSDPTDDTLE